MNNKKISNLEIKRDKISCIIAAYNEENRIGNVLNIVNKHPLIDEIIVIDDGSIDKTKEVIKRYKNVKLIEHKKNKGKLTAMINGLKKSRHEIILFLDADLIGLNQKNITELIMPVVSKKVDLSLSIRQNSSLIFKIIKLDFITGERVFNKKILGNLDDFSSLPSFGFESYMNKIVIKSKLKIKTVNWSNVSHMRKAKKQGFVKGTINDIGMVFHIIKTIGFFGILKQNIKMLKLKVR